MENENEKKTADTAVRKKPDMDKLTELIIVIMLGVTALLTAWASWIGSLHGGNQAPTTPPATILLPRATRNIMQAFSR